ncbi:putative ATP-dependent DNA ligase [Erwinia phage Micant]|uniref:DNA ligase n=1 Tax=Erwinia phage Micant TaxID=2923255 RepID=A0AAE9FMW7_9CAUD|nr:putative ATP-dependent DNA ligase [Erwinia phage Micant]
MSKLKCMKGDAFTEKRLRKWLKEDGAVVLQIKRDEFRCVVDINWKAKDNPEVYFTSPSGKPLFNLDCFSAIFIEMSHFYGTNRFDMGVCVNDSFDLTRRTVRASTKPYDLTGQSWQVIPGKKKSDLAHFTGHLKARFWFYDLPEVDAAYITRRGDMGIISLNFPEYTAVPETEIVTVRADLSDGIDKAVQQVMEVFATARELGHEGIMVKRYDHKWEPKRCPDSWMKLKPNDEVDGRIIGKTEGKGKFYGLIGSLICEAEDGSTFTISGMTDVERVAFTQHFDLYLGQWVTATYMQRDTLGGYRHPQFERMHDEKNL